MTDPLKIHIILRVDFLRVEKALLDKKRIGIFLIFSAVFLSGCSILSIPAQERGVEGFWNDSKIRIKISAAFLGDNPSGINSVENLVYKGKVLLMGIAEGPEIKKKAVEIVKKIPGVVQVIDEIVISKRGLSDYAFDIWATRRLKMMLTFDPTVHCQNYQISVSNRTAYIMGEAGSRQELENVLEHAEKLGGVCDVKHFVTILPSKR